jgi:uncharacterized membrane protein
MMKLVLAMLLLLCVGAALADTQVVQVGLKRNDIAEVQVNLSFAADAEYDTVEYTPARVPIAVISEVAYSLAENGTLIFDKRVIPGENTLSFTLLYDDAILQSGRSRTFTMQQQDASVSVTLPEGHVLASISPAVSPKPDSIESDGRSITLHWDHRESLDLILLYEAPSSSLWLILGVIAVVASGVGITLLLLRRKGKAVLLDTLSDDEQLLVSLLRKGIIRQKELCKETGFSKSKMSKIIRRLEEKKVVKKEPFFKTNKVRLLHGWR